jgi:hypothetical protein
MTASRTSTVKRIYNLGQYQNIEFTDTVSDIPESVMFDDKKMELLYMQQLLNLELNISRYYQIRNLTKDAQSPTEVIALLDGLRSDQFKSVVEELLKEN